MEGFGTKLFKPEIMQNKIQLVTTTNTVEGWEIVKYYGVVTHQIVIGANIFRDVFASFRDIFGGAVRGYQKDLDSMQAVLLQQLKEKASNMGANMIIALKLDYEDVSGGGKSMFMITATGTAVSAKPLSAVINTSEVGHLDVNSNKLNYEILKERYIASLKNRSIVIESIDSIKKLEYYNIYNYSIISNFIDKHYYHNDHNFSILYSYFATSSRDQINKFLLTRNVINIKNNKFEIILKILKDLQWFDMPIIIGLLNERSIQPVSKGLYLLLLEPENYTKYDLQNFDKLFQLLNSLKGKYPAEKVTKNLIGKVKKYWTCINCDQDIPIELNHCETPSCYSNIYGVIQNKSNPDSMISIYSERKRVLERLFTENSI